MTSRMRKSGEHHSIDCLDPCRAIPLPEISERRTRVGEDYHSLDHMDYGETVEKTMSSGGTSCPA